MILLKQDIIDELIELGRQETALDENDLDFDMRDMSGGNYDDAYFMGVSDGKSLLARELVDRLNLK